MLGERHQLRAPPTRRQWRLAGQHGSLGRRGGQLGDDGPDEAVGPRAADGHDVALLDRHVSEDRKVFVHLVRRPLGQRVQRHQVIVRQRQANPTDPQHDHPRRPGPSQVRRALDRGEHGVPVVGIDVARRRPVAANQAGPDLDDGPGPDRAGLVDPPVDGDRRAGGEPDQPRRPDLGHQEQCVVRLHVAVGQHHRAAGRTADEVRAGGQRDHTPGIGAGDDGEPHVSCGPAVPARWHHRGARSAPAATGL